jgi:hypothetical protein
MPGGVGIGAGAAETMATRPATAARREVEVFMMSLVMETFLLSFATSRGAQQEVLRAKRLLLVNIWDISKPTDRTGVQI